MLRVSNLRPGRKAWSHLPGDVRALGASPAIPLLINPPFFKAHVLLHILHDIALFRKAPWVRDQTEGVG